MKRLLTRGALLLLLCAALALPALADSVTDTISVCIGYFGWAEDEYVEKANFSWQELDDWYGGDDLWVGAFCANGAELTMTNAAFFGRTDSDNVAGTGAGMFSPDRPVTKEQAAALLVRFARMQGVSIPADAAPVYVAECSVWAQTDVQAAYAAGLLDRFSACLAAPQEAASRAERKGISIHLSRLPAIWPGDNFSAVFLEKR